MDLCDELVVVERAFWDAAGDPDFYIERFADDGVMAFHVGVFTKADVVAGMEDAPPWARFTIDDLRCIEIAPGVASLTYTTVARSTAAAEDYRAAITSVYARRDGEWMLVVHQQTPLAGS